MGRRTMRVRYGVVGTGYWAETTHARVAAQHPGIKFVGVFGRNAERRDAIATKFGGKAFPTLDDLLAEVDAIGIAVSPDIQVDVALADATDRKHVIMEKPI